MSKFIKKLNEIDLQCITDIGFKSAYIGELCKYNRKGLLLADGFAITTAMYRQFVCYNDLENQLVITLNDLRENVDVDFEKVSLRAKQLIIQAKMPADLGMAIIDAYDYMNDMTDQPVSVSTSFTFEMPFDNADKTMETDLNVQGHCALLYAVRKCFANLFSVSALKCIALNKLDIGTLDVAVCIQNMVRADKACAGAGITTGQRLKGEDVLHITGSWGLGSRTHGFDDGYDDYWIYKSSLELSIPLLEMKLGDKKSMLVAAADDNYTLQTVERDTPDNMQRCFTLNLKEIKYLAQTAMLIEQHFKKPMLFRWAKDGDNHQIFILSVCPANNKKSSSTKLPADKATTITLI